ncbi:MAG: Lrp/AsnC ligand binding domain-containing protein [Promethearchaeota archaeon]
MSEMAYIMITVTGDPQSILPKILKVKGTKIAHAVYGEYDIIILLEAPDMESLQAVINKEIRTIDGLKSSLTMPVMPETILKD